MAKATSKTVAAADLPVIALSTTKWNRKYFTVDDETYWYRDPRELTIEQTKALSALGDRMGEAAGNLDAWDSTLSDGVRLTVVDAPKKLLQIQTSLKLDIVAGFSTAAGLTAKPAAGRRRKKRTAAGRGKSSRSRKRSTSTAARSKSG